VVFHYVAYRCNERISLCSECNCQIVTIANVVLYRRPTYFSYYRTTKSRDIIVGIATGYGLDGRGVGVQVPVGSRIFSSPRCPDRLWGSTNLLSNGYGGTFPEIKRPGREADNSFPASAEVKKMWMYISTFPYAIMA
jgi:hypothetical protein